MLWEGLLHRPWLWLMGVCLPAVGGARSRHLVPALAGVDPLPWPETAAAQRPREGPQSPPRHRLVALCSVGFLQQISLSWELQAVRGRVATGAPGS